MQAHVTAKTGLKKKSLTPTYTIGIFPLLCFTYSIVICNANIHTRTASALVLSEFVDPKWQWEETKMNNKR